MKRYEYTVNGRLYELRRSNSRNTCTKCALLHAECNAECLTASRQLLGVNGELQLKYYFINP